MVVIFYKTTKEGSVEVARVIDGNGPQAFVDLLLSDGNDMETAMRNAPRRFNGAYLRAEFFDTKQFPGPAQKQADRVQPLGQPLEPWGDKEVVITPEDVAQAIREFDERVPEAAGLLVAESSG